MDRIARIEMERNEEKGRIDGMDRIDGIEPRRREGREEEEEQQQQQRLLTIARQTSQHTIKLDTDRYIARDGDEDRDRDRDRDRRESRGRGEERRVEREQQQQQQILSIARQTSQQKIDRYKDNNNNNSKSIGNIDRNRYLDREKDEKETKLSLGEMTLCGAFAGIINSPTRGIYLFIYLYICIYVCICVCI